MRVSAAASAHSRLWHITARTRATTRPQLAKADTAFQAHPFCLAVRRVLAAAEGEQNDDQMLRVHGYPVGLEDHPAQPWDGPAACGCGGAGMPCPACNISADGERPRLPSGFDPTLDVDDP